MDKKDVVGIMPTGAGKSLCFQVPAMIMDGITIVISPLISLMKDQINSLKQVGIRAAFINSSLTEQQCKKALINASNYMYKIIYVAPERLESNDFLDFALNTNISMVTIDEAHCISQWGQDFRPSYLKILDFIKQLPQKPIISAFTATATQEVKKDIINILNLNESKVLVTGFDRKNLYFEVKKSGNKFESLLNILDDKKDKVGIIYCSTRKTVEDVCENLEKQGFESTRYHAGLSDRERKNNQEDFIFDNKKIIVATNAFGMGIDKSNVNFVIHFNMPKNIESYYQEAGRAGRDGEPADCILLYSKQDIVTNMFLIENSKDKVYEDSETEKLIKLKDIELLMKMKAYCNTSGCLRHYILRYFGDNTENECGNCSNCLDKFEEKDITIESQKIFSCIKRTKEIYGSNVIADVLKGSRNKKIKSLKLDKISTYGLMSNINRDFIMDMIDYLEAEDYLFVDYNSYYSIKLTKKSFGVLRGETKILMKIYEDRQINIVTKDNELEVNIISDVLISRLKDLRMRLAQEEKVPAYVIFSNMSLNDMCIKLPRNEKEFLKISGVGYVKLEKYGDDFIKAINNFIEENPENLNQKVILKNIITKEDEKELLLYADEIKDTIEVFENPVSISEFINNINIEILKKYNCKLKIKKIGEWLVENDYLKVAGNEKSLTIKGLEIGIISEEFLSKAGYKYNKILYTKEAQESLLKKLVDIVKVGIQ